MYALIAQRSIGTILHWRRTKHARSNVNFTAFFDDDHPRKTSSPILSPGLRPSLVLIALRHPRVMLLRRSLMDSSLDVRIAKKQSDRMSKPLSAIHHVADGCLVPGEDSSTGNVPGGRKLARYV
jgi:hypothetical protein